VRAWDAADRRHHAAQTQTPPDADAMFAAEFDMTAAKDAVQAFEQDAALTWIMGFRLAVRWFPVEVSKLLDRMREHREEWARVARALEDKRRMGG